MTSGPLSTSRAVNLKHYKSTGTAWSAELITQTGIGNNDSTQSMILCMPIKFSKVVKTGSSTYVGYFVGFFAYSWHDNVIEYDLLVDTLSATQCRVKLAIKSYYGDDHQAVTSDFVNVDFENWLFIRIQVDYYLDGGQQRRSVHGRLSDTVTESSFLASIDITAQAINELVGMDRVVLAAYTYESTNAAGDGFDLTLGPILRKLYTRGTQSMWYEAFAKGAVDGFVYSDYVSPEALVVMNDFNIEYIERHDYTQAVYTPSATTQPNSNSAANKFSYYVKTQFDALGARLVNSFTLNDIDLNFPPPFDILGNFLESAFNGVIIDGLQLVVKQIVDGLKFIIFSFAEVGDIVQDFMFKDLPTVIQANFQPSVTSWFEIGVPIGKIFSGLIDDLNLDANVVFEPFMKLALSADLKAVWESFLTSYCKLPKGVRLTFAGKNFDIYLAALPFMLVPASIRNGVVPSSEYWPGRKSGDTRLATVTGYTGVGVTWLDLGIAGICYGSVFFLCGLICQYSPKVSKALFDGLFSMNKARQCSPKDVLTCLGIPYNSNYEPTGDTLYKDVSDVNDIVTATDTIIDDINSKVVTIDELIDDVKAKVLEIDGVTEGLDTMISQWSGVKSKVEGIDGEMSTVIPGRLKYLANEIYTEVTDEETGSFLMNLLSIKSQIESTATLLNTWIGYLDEMEIWLSNPNAFSRPTRPS